MPTEKSEYAHFRLSPTEHALLDQIAAHLTAHDPARRQASRSDAMRFALHEAAEKILAKKSKSC